jgi:hypothetical protein
MIRVRCVPFRIFLTLLKGRNLLFPAIQEGNTPALFCMPVLANPARYLIVAIHDARLCEILNSSG